MEEILPAAVEAPVVCRERSCKRKYPLPSSSQVVNLPNGQHELKRNSAYVDREEEEPPKKKQNCRKVLSSKGNRKSEKLPPQSDDGDAGDDENYDKRQRVRKHSDSKGKRRKPRGPVDIKENVKLLQVITEKTRKKNIVKKKKAKPVVSDQVIIDDAQVLKKLSPKKTKRTEGKRKMSLRV